MNKKDNLFNLVKSLNKQEKRFFKLYSKLHSHNSSPNYLYLFEILDNMKEFDKELMGKKLSKKFPNTRISPLKIYLKQNILNALKAFYRKNAWGLQEGEDIGIAKVLLIKKLPHLAEKMLLRMRKTAQQQEKFQLHIQINSLLIKIKNETKQNNVNEIILIQQYYDECILCTDQLKEVIQLIAILGKASRQIFSKERLSKNFQQNLRGILQEVQGISPQELQSKRANYLYHNLLYVLYRDLNKVTDSVEMIEKLKNIVEDSFYQQYPQNIINTYGNLLVSYIDSKEVENFYPILKKTQLLLKQYPHLQDRYQHWLLIRELELHAFIYHSQPSKALVEATKNYLSSSNKQFNIANENNLLIALARCYFITQDYEKSQNVILQIVLEHKGSLDEMFYLEIHLMAIFCYYELKSYKIASQRASILERKIRRSEVDNPILRNLIKKIIHIVKIPVPKLELVKELNKLIKIDNSNQGYHKNLYFLEVWTKQKA